MSTINMLFQNRIRITDKIYIEVPTIGEIVDNEDNYYCLVSALTSMPIDLMVQLDDIGIDFTQISDYELFILLFSNIRDQDTKLVFGDLDLSKFEIATNTSNNTVVLIDKENDIVIDKSVYDKISNTLRRIHNMEKNMRKPANQDAKDFMLKRARDKFKRHKNRKEESSLESIIIAMVNTEQFKYDFKSVRDMTIYQFNESVRQIIKKVDYEHRMSGVYAGTLNVKDLSQEDLNWLTHK